MRIKFNYFANTNIKLVNMQSIGDIMIKITNKDYKKRIKIRFIIGIFLIICIIATAAVLEYRANEKATYKEKMIRFHVIANSNTQEDQNLKLKVRDAVINKLNPKLINSSSIQESREIVLNNMNLIKNTAISTINDNGYDYSVQVKLGKTLIPQKSYGDITLPAGKYEALNVMIGNAEGENWWCVLFPPLCLIDVDQGLTTEDAKENMLKVLTEEEYNMITAVDKKKELPIKLEFKTLELIEDIKTKVSDVKIAISE